MDRRAFMLAAVSAGVAAFLPRRARAIGEHSMFTPATVVHGGRFNPRPSALRRLMLEIGRRTSIEAAFEPVEIELSSPELFSYPFLYLSGDGAFPPFAERDSRTLGRFLAGGGFLLADSAEERGDGFLGSVKREVERSVPHSALARLPPEHPVYKSFYMLKGASGRTASNFELEGAAIDGRTAVIVSKADMGGAWSRDPLGNWDFTVSPGGEPQREMAFRTGVNIVMYSMCTDYKDDSVHLPFILRRRKR